MPYDPKAVFTGGSGQMAVMGELLDRKCNAAVPHVDIGMDVFAFQDAREEVARIQVKTASGKWYAERKGYNARFNIPKKQLDRTDDPPLFYALAVRLDIGWGCFIVISRAKLQELRNNGCGSEFKSDLGLNIAYRPSEQAGDVEDEADVVNPPLVAHCGDINLTEFINAWESLPPLKAQVAIDVDRQDA